MHYGKDPLASLSRGTAHAPWLQAEERESCGERKTL